MLTRIRCFLQWRLAGYELCVKPPDRADQSRHFVQPEAGIPIDLHEGERR